MKEQVRVNSAHPALTKDVVFETTHAVVSSFQKLRPYLGRRWDVIGKDDGVDMKSQFDQPLEEAVKARLEKTTGIPCVGEELGGDLAAKLRFDVDIIDGTPNAGDEMDCWGMITSLNDNVTGLVTAAYLPKRGEFYLAVKGMGAYMFDLSHDHVDATSEGLAKKIVDTLFTEPNPSLLTATRLQVHSMRHLPPKEGEKKYQPFKRFHVSEDLGYEGRDWKLRMIANYANDVKYMPIFGSILYSLCMIAKGNLQGHIAFDVGRNDTNHFALMQESGMVFSNGKGDPFTMDSRTLVVANCEEFRKFLVERINQPFDPLYIVPQNGKYWY
ncbi:hypothetical protein HY641_00155 [Candidatus Woesearchaeota archaeon]|nr:hypothetical protein [Candidatus Woesearchaeota archaeon]